MLDNKVDKIVLVCGTAHYFLDQVYERLPEAENHIVDIIDSLGERLHGFSSPYRLYKRCLWNCFRAVSFL